MGVQTGLVGQVSLELALAPVVGDDPQGDREDAARLLLDTGGVVGLVAVAGGDDAGWVLGVSVDLDEVVVLVAGAGDHGVQVGSQGQVLAGRAQVGAPAVRLSGDGGGGAEQLADGLVDNGASLGDGQQMGQEAGRDGLVAPACGPAGQGACPVGGQSPDAGGGAAPPAADAALQARHQVLLQQPVEVTQGLTGSRAQAGVGVSG